MLFLSLLLIVALCQVPTDGIKCYQGSLPSPDDCTDAKFCKTMFVGTQKPTFACGCGENKAGCFYDSPNTVCCCNTDSCNDPKNVTSRKCWEGEGPVYSSYENSASCLTLNIPGAEFCSQVIKGQDVMSAGCGCTTPTSGKTEVPCACTENGCHPKEPGSQERVCCCNGDDCNDPNELITTTTTPTTTTPTTARPESTTTDDYDDDLPTAKPYKVIYKPRPRESFCDGDWLCWLTCAFATIAATLLVGMVSVAGYALWVWRRTQH